MEICALMLNDVRLRFYYLLEVFAVLQIRN